MFIQARTFADSFIWGFLIVFFAPTALIVASWKAIPGDFFFPVKIGVEKAALFIISPSSLASGSLQIHYAERRLSEAQTLMAMRQSVTGLTYFEKQMQETSTAILRTTDPKIRGQLANEYAQSLTTMSVALAKDKKQIAAQITTQTYTTSNTQISPNTNTVYIPNADNPTSYTADNTANTGQTQATVGNPRVSAPVPISSPVVGQALPPAAPQTGQIEELYKKYFGDTSASTTLPTPTPAGSTDSNGPVGLQPAAAVPNPVAVANTSVAVSVNTGSNNVQQYDTAQHNQKEEKPAPPPQAASAPNTNQAEFVNTANAHIAESPAAMYNSISVSQTTIDRMEEKMNQVENMTVFFTNNPGKDIPTSSGYVAQLDDSKPSDRWSNNSGTRVAQEDKPISGENNISPGKLKDIAI